MEQCRWIVSRVNVKLFPLADNICCIAVSISDCFMNHFFIAPAVLEEMKQKNKLKNDESMGPALGDNVYLFFKDDVVE